VGAGPFRGVGTGLHQRPTVVELRAVDRHQVGGIAAYPRSPMMLQSNQMPAIDGWVPGTGAPSEFEERRGGIMATVQRPRPTREIQYPTTDGKPMAETQLHRDDMMDTIQILEDYYAAEPNVYVGGNLLLCHEEGNRRKHVAPDVFVVLGVPKEPPRDNYLVWKEEKAPDFVTEITSKSTKHEDQKKKREIYRDILKVSEYFLFDPRAEYLDPPIQGFRLVDGDYVRIEPVEGRLPSKVLALHLERAGTRLRLYNPATGEYLPTRLEAREAEHRRAEAADQRAEAADQRAEAADQRAEAADQRAEAADQRAEAAEAARRQAAEELDRLRREIEGLRRG
jgi:Uma2 family endonuclease